MCAATMVPNVKWGGTDFKWGGRAPMSSPLATTLGESKDVSKSHAECNVLTFPGVYIVETAV